MKKKIYLEVNQEFSVYTHLNHDCVFLHDPQPLPLIKYSHKRQPWIWRCHIDLSDPNKELWSFLKQFILRYDLVIFSNESYMKPDLPVEQKIVYPAIDPLALKNRELSEDDILKYVTKAGIPTDKPVISQISRMDPWKDPEGVLDVFELVKKQVDCRLVYCYNLATDDPEGMEIYSRVHKKAEDWVKRGDVIFVVGNNDILVNAIQRFSSVIIQKSIKEGFNLSVTEALWKERPVVASNVGGIPVQIKDRQTGFLVEPNDFKACADRIAEFLKKPALAKKIGKQAKEYVRENFLTTRLLLDYLDILGGILK